MLPAGWALTELTTPPELHGLILLTVHPDRIAPSVLEAVDHLVAVGPDASSTVSSFASAIGISAPDVSPFREDGPALSWRPGDDRNPRRYGYVPARSELRRHRRKYAEGELGEDKSFYFRGPELKLNLRAQNLTTFAQLAEGVDDETWLHHLARHDYSRWFRAAIKDDDLTKHAEEAEEAHPNDAAASREVILEAIRSKYTAPAA